MDVQRRAAARLDRWRGKLIDVADRIARAMGGGDTSRWLAETERRMVDDPERARLWLADGARWGLLGEALVEISGVTGDHAQRYFFDGGGDTSPALVLERLTAKLLAERPGRRDEAEVMARVQHRLFVAGEWPKWLASPTPDKALLRQVRWCAAALDRDDRVDPWADVPEETGTVEPSLDDQDRNSVRAALNAALRTGPVKDAEVLHLTWTHELLEPEIRWLLEKKKPVNHRISGAFRRLVKRLARQLPGVLGDVDAKALDATPPRQSDRRQEASRALRARLIGLSWPAPPPSWDVFELVDTPAAAPKARPKRAKLSTIGVDPHAPIDRTVLSDDDVAAIALGWLYGCGWSAAEDPADRHPRAARLTHLLAMGRNLDDVRAEVIAVVDDDRTLAEWMTLSSDLHGWLVQVLDVNGLSAQQALGASRASTPDDQEDE